ncbi:esterase/lipase family protein [Streptomyces yangpuensis]|uniref:esterase/lipase family protein n=1 Tax=Streptomyces yangpuensis TaxID=1648182 RepID=UPI003813EA73
MPGWPAGGEVRPRLVFVAHSMGGLVARAALEQDPELAADTRVVVTVGTPFLGSVKSVLPLSLLHASAKPERLVRRVQAMAATLPGVHDLLPGYRCLDRGLDVERLTEGDVERYGGDRVLAARSPAEPARHRTNGFLLPRHRAAVGEAQPTLHSLEEQRANLSVVVGRQHAFDVGDDGEFVRDPATGIPARYDAAGESTVHMPSARSGADAVPYVFGQHGTLMRHDEVLQQIRRIALEPRHRHPGRRTPHRPPGERDALAAFTAPDGTLHLATGSSDRADRAVRIWTLGTRTARAPPLADRVHGLTDFAGCSSRVPVRATSRSTSHPLKAAQRDQ